MELSEALSILDNESYRQWLYKQANAELDDAIVVVRETARVVFEERARIAAQRRESRRHD
jgi:hypothetical protein